MSRSLGIVILFLFPIALFSQDLLFQEQFTGGQMQNEWFPGFSGNSMDVKDWPNNPSGDGWVGMLGNHISGGNVGATHAAPIFTDFYYEAQVYIPVNEGVYYGLEFRVDSTSPSSGYQFIARFMPGGMVTPRLRFRVRPLDNPSMPTVIKDWEAADIPGGIPIENGWHKLAVKAAGHRFWFYYDGQELPGSPIMDFSFLSGTIGGYVWDSSSPMLNLYIDDINVYSDIPLGISDPPATAASTVLLNSYPNPVSSTATIVFDLPSAAYATVELLNLLGQRVALLGSGDYSVGQHEVAWQRPVAPRGMYFIRLNTDLGVSSHPVFLN
ncbi:MAG: T9SS type A sorting domain-containing protein [Bacteroidota bacterium]